jgi:AcrR family transcriptional regulator
LPEFKVHQRKTSASRKAQLIEIAAKIFVEEGYRETGIERILKQAGLTGPALYRHFSSKQEILDTICIGEMRHILDLALEVQSEKHLDAEEMLRKLIRTRLDYVFGPMGNSSMLVISQRAHLSPAAREQVLAMQREFRAICGEMLKKIRPNISNSESNVIIFATQNVLISMMWRSKGRAMLSESDLKNLLEKMMWNTLLG